MKAKIASFLPVGARRGVLTLELDGDFRGQYDKLKDTEIEITIQKFSKKRSLDANAYLWKLCGEIAKKLGITKEQVYRKQIREVGEYTPLPIKEEAVDAFSRIWAEHGIGWFIEVIDDSKLPGYKLIFAYQGSSTYDTKQMSRLIENVIQDAKALGIETRSSAEIDSLLRSWK